MLKQLPEPVSITEDGSVKVIGWVDKRSFIVKSLPLVTNIPQPETTGIENKSPISLDGEEDNIEEEIEYKSLWNWCRDNSVSIDQFMELQERLETYIDFSLEEDASLNTGGGLV